MIVYWQQENISLIYQIKQRLIFHTGRCILMKYIYLSMIWIADIIFIKEKEASPMESENWSCRYDRTDADAACKINWSGFRKIRTDPYTDKGQENKGNKRSGIGIRPTGKRNIEHRFYGTSIKPQNPKRQISGFAEDWICRRQKVIYQTSQKRQTKDKRRNRKRWDQKRWNRKRWKRMIR